MKPSFLLIAGVLSAPAVWAAEAGESVRTTTIVAAPEVSGTASPEGKIAEASKRPYLLRGGLEFRSLVVSKVNPAQDRSMTYWARADYQLSDQGSVFLRLGLNQVFVVREGHPAFLLQDTYGGFRYSQSVVLSGLGRERPLSLLHSAILYLPTSKVSWLSSLIVAPEVRSQASLELVPRLTLGLEGRAQYRFHRYAESGNASDTMNTRLSLMAHPFAAYEIADFGKYGKLETGADLFYTWRWRYASREQYDAPTSDAAPLLPSLGWDAYVGWSPIPAVTLTLSVEQNSPVLREGIVNQDSFFDRDETEVALGVTGRF